jgi:hypothetical protein
VTSNLQTNLLLSTAAEIDREEKFYKQSFGRLIHSRWFKKQRPALGQYSIGRVGVRQKSWTGFMPQFPTGNFQFASTVRIRMRPDASASIA